MWDFSVFRAMGLMLRTLPFLLLRVAVCLGIAAALALGWVAGAAVGRLFEVSADQSLVAVWGGAAGVLIVAALVHLRRDQILFLVKAGHVALMVEALDGRRLPLSTGQISLARAIVAERFAEARSLLALDRLVRAVIRTATGMVDGLLEGLLPLALLDRLTRATGMHLRLAIGLIDAVVLGHAIRSRSENAWEAAHDGLVLYTQNARPVMTNAVWLQLVGWGLAAVLLLSVLSPAATVAAFLPAVPGAALLLAALFAWVVKAALYDPFATACMLQLHLRLTEGQEPLPEWRGRLTQVSDKFRLLGERALGWGT